MSLNAFEKICLVRKIQDVSQLQKLILLTICSHLGENDFSFLSLTTIQKECCIKGRQHITSNIEKLIQKGYLIKIKPSDGFKSNRYGIDFNLIASNVKLLVTESYQTSNVKLLDQSLKVTSLVTESYPKEIENNLKKNKVRERSQKPLAEKPHTDNFLPNEENKILCDTLGLNLEDEVQKFISRHKYQKTQPEFAIWLKGSSSYKKSTTSQKGDEVRSAVQFWGPGHPGWESLHGKGGYNS